MKKKKKRSIVPVLILFVLLACLAAGFFFLFPRISFKDGERVYEKGEIYPAESVVVKANGTLTPENDVLDTAAVGEHHFRYTVKKLFFTRELDFVYEVVDTTPPKIEIRESTVYRDPGETYTEEEMRANITVDEGTLSFSTDYDPQYSGTYTVFVHAVDDSGNESDASYEAVVKDTEAPVMFRSGNGAQILVGKDFDIHSVIGYGDNADPVQDLKIDGEVDTSEPGIYPLHVAVTDASGNRKEWDLDVEVVEEIPKSEPYEYEYPFEEFMDDYAGSRRKFGIDVSEWQGDIDFEAAKEAGCEFVIIRVGWSYLGELNVDKKFHQNLERAKAAGMQVGIYLFCYDNNDADLISSTGKMFAELGDVSLDMPVVFDWENFRNFQEYEISFQQLNHLYDVFEKEVAKRGYESMLYGSAYYLRTVWNHTDTRPVWMAQYAAYPNYQGKYQIWQASDSGKLAGIDGPVDLNIWYTR